MSRQELLSNLDVDYEYPFALRRVVALGLTNLEPWHIMGMDLASTRMAGLRTRYSAKYIPFARRQDNDDLACFDPQRPQVVVVVHDFADTGDQERVTYSNFWEWFRSVVEDMIDFE